MSFFFGFFFKEKKEKKKRQINIIMVLLLLFACEKIWVDPLLDQPRISCYHQNIFNANFFFLNCRIFKCIILFC